MITDLIIGAVESNTSILAPNGAPSALSLTVNSDTAITLNWTIGSTNHDGHRIYISTDNVTFTEKGTVTGSTATYQATGLTQGTKYYFYVVAYNGFGEGDSSETVNATTLMALTRNSDIVWSGGLNKVATNGEIGAYFYLNKNNNSIVRINGTITKVKLNLIKGTGTTYVYFRIYRKNGTVYDEVFEENIAPKMSFSGAEEITLNTGCDVKEGDYVSLRLIRASTTSYKTGQTANSLLYSTSDSVPTADTGNDFDTICSKLAYTIIVTLYGQAPVGVLIGDSIVSGYYGNASGIEKTILNNPANSIGGQLYLLDNNYIIQNMGTAGNDSPSVLARFTAHAVDIKPRFVYLHVGVNDIGYGVVTKEQYMSNMTSMLDACATNSIIPVVGKILPVTDFSNAQMQTRDDWMTDLQTLVATYEGSVWIDFDADLGKFRAGGDAGNLWDLQTEYDYDGVHLTQAGYTKMAEVIDREFKKKYVPK